MNITLASPGIWQYILVFILILSIFIFPLFLVLYKRDEREHDIPWWTKVLLLLPSLTLVGLAVSSYILFRKKEFENDKAYKFSRSTRNYAVFLLILSVASSVTWLLIQHLGVQP